MIIKTLLQTSVTALTMVTVFTVSFAQTVAAAPSHDGEAVYNE